MAAVSRTIFGGHGIGFACTVAARLLASDGLISFQLGSGGALLVSTNDRYWLQPLLLDRSYELDLDHFLKRTLTARDVFFDCGANLGLWSIAAAHVIRDPARVIAIEASSRTFTRLLANLKANNRNFTALHRALSDVTSSSTSFYASAGDHASATLVEDLSPDDAQSESVATISLLDLVRERTSSEASDALIFLKLDIEGMERRVLATINPAQNSNIVILYEDHGSDTTHATTVFLLGRGFVVALMGDDGELERIRQTTLDRLDVLKVNPARGYNFLAITPGGAAATRLLALYPQDKFG
jgi:FkbM family methyltransferase